jgi:hypothetical protein
MTKGYAEHLVVNTFFSTVMVFTGVYTIHIAPALPGPNSTDAASSGSVILTFIGIFCFALATFIEAVTLCRFFAPLILLRKSPKTILRGAMAAVGLVFCVFLIWAGSYVIGVATDSSKLIFMTLLVAWTSALAVAQWASVTRTHTTARR